jgi:tRNA1(Val) A37 N6-methylase TrmN6
VALHRERRLAHSLKRDIRSAVNPPIRFTNVDDVTQNHANQRAIIGTIAKSVFRNAASILPQNGGLMFLRRDLRREPIKSLISRDFDHAAELLKVTIVN